MEKYRLWLIIRLQILKKLRIFKIPSSPPQQNRHKIPRGGFNFFPGLGICNLLAEIYKDI